MNCKSKLIILGDESTVDADGKEEVLTNFICSAEKCGTTVFVYTPLETFEGGDECG